MKPFILEPVYCRLEGPDLQLRKPAKSIISLVLAMLALEGLVRATDEDRRIIGDPFKDEVGMMQFLVPDPYFQWRGRAGMRLITENEYLNSRGFRAPDHAREKRPGVIRVAVLGDSCSFGIVASGPMRLETPRPYAGLLQDLFDRNMGSGRVEVLNYALIGYTSFHGLRVLKREALPDNPDFVVIRFGWNDHLASLTHRSYSNPRSLWIERLEDLYFKSRLLTLLSWRGMPMEYTRKHKIPWAVSANPVVWVRPDDYAWNLSRMIDIARAHGATPILIDAPAAPVTPEIKGGKVFIAGTGYVTLDQLLQAHARYRAITDRVAREKGVLLVRTDAPPAESARYFSRYDIAHPMAEGHLRIARRLYTAMVESIIRQEAR